MIKSYLPKTGNEKEQLQDLILIVAWGVLLTLHALSIKNYYLAGQPPLWDSLGYQLKSLHILTNWLDGNFYNSLQYLYAQHFPGHILALAGSFLLFGFNHFSPYLASAFFGIGCLVLSYLLSRELGASRRAAFWWVLAFSLLPNFIYQGFLQTRNDYPLAFFLTLSWLFILQGVKNENLKKMFLAGVIAGIGTLFKASAPGYMIWGILLFLIFPEKLIKLNIKLRTKLSLVFIGGAITACAWHYLPNLGKIIGYYKAWGQGASTWQAIQYKINLDWTDYLFYPKNLVQVQLGENISLALTLILVVLFTRWAILRRGTISEKNCIQWKFINLVFWASFLAIAFVSFRRVFATIGIIPILPLLVSVYIALASKFSLRISVPTPLLLAFLPVGLLVSISHLDLYEKEYLGQNIEMLSRETMNIRKEFGLGKTPMMQVFSHPIYNVDSLAWLWLLNPKTDKDLVHRTTEQHLLFFPEDGEKIASKLTKFPFLIKSEFPGTIIKGEPFHTFNRLHSEINSAIKEQNQFIKIKKIKLENEKFPIYFLINKNFSVLRPKGETADGWLAWENEVEFFSSRKTKFIWRGLPIRKIDSFKLVDKDNKASFIKMKLNKILPNGKYEYQSEMVPATDKLLTFIVMPEFSHLLLPASKRDKRMLAFNQVETKLIKYD